MSEHHPDHHETSGDWPQIPPEYHSFMGGASRFMPYIGDQPMRYLQSAYVQLEYHPALRPYHAVLSKLGQTIEYADGSRDQAGFSAGYVAVSTAVYFESHASHNYEWLRIMAGMRAPAELPNKDPDEVLSTVTTLSRVGQQHHKREIELIFGELRQELGQGYDAGLLVGMGFAAERFDAAWSRWRFKEIDRAAHQLTKDYNWDSLLYGQ